MDETPKSKSGWKILRRILLALAIFATLVAVFYAEEDWRGKRAWENCKRELEAKGEVLDWNKFIPPPVPDDQNFFKAPRMTEWFVKGLMNTNGVISFHPANEMKALSTNGITTAVITNEAVAINYLKWSDQFQPDFDLIRDALKRPYATMDGDYSVPYQSPIPNFISVRTLAQVLAQRAKCYLLLGQPEKALNELTFLNDSRRLLEGAPTGKPMTLVAAMINVAVTGLYADTIADGFQKQAWQEPQLAALQKQLEQINVPSFVAQAFESEPAATTRTLEITSAKKLTKLFSQIDPKQWKWALWPMVKSALIPRGWIYQNMATEARLVYKQTQGFDSANDIIQPQKFTDLTRELNTIAKPYKFIAAEMIPNFTKAWQTTAYNQTLVNEAQIVCALERYRFAHDKYPESLDALAPQFIEKLPHDIIGGQPLHYRRTSDGKFLLYSVGWNETDDGGQETSAKTPYGGIDYTKGDWVWKN
jgi:hypothetical protein